MHTLLPLSAQHALQLAAQSFPDDEKRRQKEIEQATQRIRFLYPQCFAQEPTDDRLETVHHDGHVRTAQSPAPAEGLFD